jgi:tetratricopeptide (TPR) repeat protein
VGRDHDAARVSAKLGELLWQQFIRLDEAVALMDASLGALAESEPDEDVSFLMAQAGRLHFFQGNLEAAFEWVDRALAAAESRGYPEVLSQALNTKSLLLKARGRYEEARALMKHAVDVAVQNDLTRAAWRATYNLADDHMDRSEFDVAWALDQEALALARRLGDRVSEMMTAMHLAIENSVMGRWDEAVAMIEEVMPRHEGWEEDRVAAVLQGILIPILVWRGDLGRAEEVQSRLEATLGDSTETQDRHFLNLSRALVHLARGRPREALEAAEAATGERETLTLRGVAFALQLATEAAFDLGRLDKVAELLSIVESAPPIESTPWLRGYVARFRARLAALAGDEREAEARYAEAVRLFGEAGLVFWQATARLEYAEWLASRGRGEEARPLLSEARETFERLRATPWLERADRLRPAERAPATAKG